MDLRLASANRERLQLPESTAKSMKRRTAHILVPVLVGCGAFLGGLYGPLAHTSAASPTAELPPSLRSFTTAYSLVESNFADRVTAEHSVYQGAIPGMLRTLDPHSNFLDPESFTQMQREQRGQYFGVGMEIGMDGHQVIVVQPFPGSPARLAGLRRGDILVAVDGHSAEGMEYERVADMLRGARGTPVTVKVRREGIPELLELRVVRGEISPANVYAFWLQPGVAYLRIKSFDVQTTGSQVEREFQRLGEPSVSGLVLDLRGNPGGLVSEAVSVAGRFLRKGQTVVSHHGRSSAEQIFRAKNGTSDRRYPIVVLVDRNSASAAEIVAGALQDHDRALVMGENTFGKGLVQAQFPLSEGALLLTIARYYTPSGRLIQRDYSNRSFFDYYNQRDADARNPLDVKMTDAGRTVYGGGGISPDEKFPTPRYNPFQSRLGPQGFAVFRFASRYFAGRAPSLPPDWKPDDALIDQFRQYLAGVPVAFTDAEFAANRAWVGQQLRQEFVTRAFDKIRAEELAIQDDPEVRKAVSSLPVAQTLMERARGVLARRAG
jgi:carboxyl-terminal processing protease